MGLAPLARLTLIATATVLFITWYFPRYYVPRPMPFNPYLGAAVTFAFGEGFKDPFIEPGSKLNGFLNHSVPSTLQYEDIPHPIAGGEMSPFQRCYFYLVALIGLCWRIFGVNWAGLGPLVGTMAAISVLCVYGVLRTRVRPALAMLGSLALLACPTHLALIQDTRDYSKTPVFFAVFYLLSILLTRPMKARSLLTMGVVLGVITGLGYGIRQDSLVVWAIIPFVFAFFLPTGVLRMPLARVGSLAVAFGLFLAFAYPPMAAQRTMENSTAHHLLGGLFKYSHDTMGMGGAPYIWFNESLTTDNFANTIVQDHNRRLAGKRTEVQHRGLEYEKAGQSFIRGLARVFPADFLTSFFAASLTTIRDGPWLIVGSRPTMYDRSDPLIYTLQNAQAGLRATWNKYGPWIVFISLAVLSWHSLRLALGVTCLLIFFTGYTSLQFQPRHFWHLGVIFVCVATFMAEEVLRILGTLLAGRSGIKAAFAALQNRQRGRNVAAYVALVCLGITSMLWTTRAYQESSVRALFQTYHSAQLIPGTISSIDATSDGARIIRGVTAPKTSESDPRFRYDVQYLALSFKGSGPLPTSVTVLNENFSPINLQELTGGMGRGPVTLFFPATQGATKTEIEVRGGDPTEQFSLYSVANPDEFPVNMVLALPDNSDSLSTSKSFVTPIRAEM
jgi:hypothetical protein